MEIRPQEEKHRPSRKKTLAKLLGGTKEKTGESGNGELTGNRWVSYQPGAFLLKINITGGKPMGVKWKGNLGRGHGT